MRSRNAIIVLIIILIVLVFIGGFFYINNKNNRLLPSQEQNKIKLNEKIDREQLIKKRIEEKVKMIEATLQKEATGSNAGMLSQEQMDFIANPRKTVEQELKINNKN